MRNANGSRCPSHQRIVRYETDGTETQVSALRDGRVVVGLYVFTSAGTPNVYFSSASCRTNESDVYDSVVT